MSANKTRQNTNEIGAAMLQNQSKHVANDRNEPQQCVAHIASMKDDMANAQLLSAHMPSLISSAFRKVGDSMARTRAKLWRCASMVLNSNRSWT